MMNRVVMTLAFTAIALLTFAQDIASGAAAVEVSTIVRSSGEVQSKSGVVHSSAADLRYPQTAAELKAHVTPLNYEYPAGNVLRYGADPTGKTDNYAIFLGAVAALGQAGGVVEVPAGIYLYESSSFVAIPNGVTVQGQGRYASVITTSNPIAKIFYVNGVGAAVRSIGFRSLTRQTGGVFVQLAGTANVLEDFNFSGDCTAIEITGAVTKIRNGTFNSGASGCMRVIVDCGDASPVIEDILFLAQPAPYPSYAIDLQHVTALTITNVSTLNQGIGLGITPGNGQSVNNLMVNASFFDSGTYGVFAQPSGSGNISRISFVDSRTMDSSKAGFFANNAGTGIFAGIDLIDHQASVNAGPGISLSGVITGVSIIGGVEGQDLVGVFDAASGDITILGNKIGAYEGYTSNATFGITFADSVTSGIVAQNSFSGNKYGPVSNHATTIIFGRNVGYDPFSGTTRDIGGSSIANGACSSSTIGVSGATTSMPVAVTPNRFPGVGFLWIGYVPSAGTVVVEVCNVSGASATPAASAYNVRVIQ